MSVIKLEILPISTCVLSEVLVFMYFIPGISGYCILGSNPSSSFSGGLLVMLTLPFPVGITITVSPSKSAPDKRSATLLFIHTASSGFLPIIFAASFCLLFTVSIGISNNPPCGKRTKATLLPFSKLGAYTSVSFMLGTGSITWYFCPGNAAACKCTAEESQSSENDLSNAFLTVGLVKDIISSNSACLSAAAKSNCCLTSL